MESGLKRLTLIKNHLEGNTCAYEVKYSQKPDGEKLTWFKKQGWGYVDTEFKYDEISNQIMVTGNRYVYSGKILPNFKEWADAVLGMEIGPNVPHPKQDDMEVNPPMVNEGFMSAIEGQVGLVTQDKWLRIHHSHGHTMQELWVLRYGKFDRVVDLVVFPLNQSHVEKLVSAASQNNVVLIPYGGGTNVTQALMLPENENRVVVSVDMTKMNKVKWVDRENLTACCEAGILGQDLERELVKYGVVCGHEPDSAEFSSLGGWISTRASGMKKNVYGNIEDILISVTVVTPIGTFTKTCEAQRVSSGPDLNHMILGSEGNFGIITEAIIKVKPTPEAEIHGSIIFPNFENGVKFMYEVGRAKIYPASIRLVDNVQFQFGMALKPEEPDEWTKKFDKIKKFYVTKVRGFDPQEMCAATLMFVGSNATVAMQQKFIYSVGKKYGGMKAGSENGERGYFLTFVIAYIRDISLDYNFMAESFETCVPWSGVLTLCKSVKEAIYQCCERKGVERKPFYCARVTQVYETSATVYIYFGFNIAGLEDPMHTYSEVEEEAREEILRCGGSLSHHHGVGKLRKPFMAKCTGETGMKMLRGMKKTLDPNNIFGAGNLM